MSELRPGRDTGRRAFGLACALTLLLAGLYAFPLRSLAGFTAVPGDLGDARFNSFVLEHVYRWMVGREPSLWSPPFFYPSDHVLAFSDSHLGTVPVYAALRLLGLAREVAFDGWILVGCAASFLGCWWALGRLGLGPLAAGAGAFIFAFGAPMLAQFGHAQLVYRFAIPLALQALWEAFQTRRALPLWRVALWTAVQFLGSIYLGLFLLYLLAAGALSLLLLQGWRPVVAMVRSLRSETAPRLGLLIGGWLGSATAVALLMVPYIEASREYGFGPRLSDIRQLLPYPVSYLLGDGNVLYHPLSRLVAPFPIRHEHQLFFGLAAWVLLLAGIATTAAAARWRPLGLFALLTLCGLVLATLSLDGHSAYLLIAPLPGIGAIRAVTRIVLVMLLPVGILAGIGVQAIHDQRGRRARPLALVGLAAVLLLLPLEALWQSIGGTPIAEWRARLATLRAKLPDPLPAGAILLVTSRAADVIPSEIDAMLLAQELGIPTFDGYSGIAPPGYRDPLTCMVPGQVLARDRLTSAQLVALADRAVTLAREPCTESPPRVLRIEPIGPEVAPLIGLAVTSLRRVADRVTATVVVTNHAAQRLDPLSVAGESLKLSWRFVPADPALPPEQGWNTRLDLAQSIEAGGARSYELTADLPAGGPFLLQVSMVQENVFWLHDHGLVIATAPVPPAAP